MENTNKPTRERVLMTITKDDEAEIVCSVFESLNVPILFQFRAKGTASNEIKDIFGLSGSGRLISMALVPKIKVNDTFRALLRKLPFYKRGGGIAVTIPIGSMQNHVHKMIDQETLKEGEVDMREEEKKDNMEYTLLITAVASGHSDEVVAATLKAGARGGTVVKGKRNSTKNSSEFFGVPVKDEQELIFTIVPKASAVKIMNAINTECGLTTESHGITFSVPVDNAIGLA